VIAATVAVPVVGQSVEPGQNFTARVVEVEDGDTFDVRCSAGGEVTIRLHGVDAPESAQPYGTEATQTARQYIGGKDVRVSVEDVDRYGRAVARIEVGGGDLSEMLVRDGLAWWYRRYAPDAAELERLEQQARNAGRGLWSRPNPVPPWKWRDRNSSGGGQPADDRDCSDFSTQPEAQRFFERHQPADPHRLDGDGNGVACESLPGGGEASSAVNALFDAASSGPSTGDSNVGWRLGVGLHGVPQLTSGVLYGLNAGVEFRWGRLRAPIGANVMFKSKSREGYNYDEGVDRCRAPDGQFAEDGACTTVSTYAWARATVAYDFYVEPAEGQRAYAGVGGDVGSFSGVHGAVGLALNSFVFEVRAGPSQFGIASSLSF
jgi:endonuclease YncB( thermonuclease family)